ncbi:MAG: YjbQ family protein [Rhizobiales bacterium]|nr:YjbQ family protein [Hyphomicrobiales bacterium]
MQTSFSIQTHGQGLYEFTREVNSFVTNEDVRIGLLTLFVRHTSCAVTIQENADPEVKTDLKNFFSKLVPPTSDPSMAYITHTYEGEDDMPAHIKSALTQVSISIPIVEGRLALGTWQGIYLFEHRDAPHDRQVVAHISA